MIARSGIGGGFRAAVGMVSALGALAFVGCIERPVKGQPPVQQSGVNLEVVNDGIDKVDLLMMVDNSNSMRDNQTHIMAQLGTMITQLTSPPCGTAASPHLCDATNPDDHPIYPPVSDMHVGVVSSDLGTPNAMVPGCAFQMYGDDGILNPIRYGGALMQHEPATVAPASFGRPTDCTDINQYPSFISFNSATTDVGTFTHDFQCNAGLYVSGCGLESQLEAVWRALIWHNPSDAPGNNDPNAGFLRDNALLALVFLTDEEDGSVRNCQYANGPGSADVCSGDGLDVYQPGSANWATTNLNMRFYMYQPGGTTDPTWPLDRYVTPNDPTHGFYSLKPNHPERIVFAAITGVPINIAMHGTGDDATIDWDSLLGTPPTSGDPNDFLGRVSATAISTMTTEGPISMIQANQDPNCPDRVVPACRRLGTVYNPMTCDPDTQYFAWPARRIVEIARRFDQADICPGGLCRNGLVTSICADDYGPAMEAIIHKIQSRLTGKCLPRVLQQTAANADATQSRVDCVIRELTAVDTSDTCDGTHGRTDPIDPSTMMAVPTHVTQNGQIYRVCEVNQVFTVAGTSMPADPNAHGWFYNSIADPVSHCAQQITFTNGDSPGPGTDTKLECIQSITGVPDASTTGG